MTRRFLVSVIFNLLFITFVTAQNATLKGKMLDASNNDPLPFANVIVGEEGTGVNTDLDGNYEISLPAGSHKITYSFVGYDDVVKDVTLIAGEVKVLDVSMGAGAELLEQVVVTTNKSAIKVGKSTVSVAVVQPDLVENTNSTAIDQVVEKVPGVTIVDGQANIRGGSGYSYGAGSRVLLLVDDMPFLTGDAGFPNWRDIPVENLNQIEILKGAASALYGSSALNGVINVRTAYPTSEPYTKVSVFGTYFDKPASLDTCANRGPGFVCNTDTTTVFDYDWWNKDQEVRPVFSDREDTVTHTPKYFGGYAGFRKPVQTGIQVAHRQKFGKFDLVLGGNYFYSDSHLRNEYERKTRVNFNTRYRVKDNLSIGINGNVNLGKSSSFFIWDDPWEGGALPFSDFVTVNNSKRFNVDPYITFFDNKENRHKILTRYYYVENDNGNNQENTSNNLYGEYQFQRKFKGLGDLGVVAGMVGMYSTSLQAGLYGYGDYRISNYAGYLQVDKGFIKNPEQDDYKLNISGGFRYELNTLNSNDFIRIYADTSVQDVLVASEPKITEARPVFRLGLNYEPVEYTYIRASWGQGYRFPSIAEKFVTTSISLIGIYPNPQLESETGWSTDIGIKQGFKISDWQGFADLSLFWTEYQNMMQFTFGDNQFTGIDFNTGDSVNVSEPGFRSANDGDVQIPGFEISLAGQGRLFNRKTQFIGGYTFIDPKYKEWEPIHEDSIPVTEGQFNAYYTTGDENVLKYRSRHTFTLDAQTDVIPDKFSLGVSLQYSSYMQTLDDYLVRGVPIEILGNIVYIPLFGLEEYRDIYKNKGNFSVDARIAYNITKGVKISMVGKNLTNSFITTRPALINAPRNITLRADVKF